MTRAATTCLSNFLWYGREPMLLAMYMNGKGIVTIGPAEMRGWGGCADPLLSHNTMGILTDVGLNGDGEIAMVGIGYIVSNSDAWEMMPL